MTNNIQREIAEILQESERSDSIIEEEREFLLSDQQVMDKIISGLIKDFKYL